MICREKGQNLKNRDSSLDLVRIIATYLVLSVHFLLHIDFYAMSNAGIRVFTMSLIRTFCMSCVPLFMLLTGYLMNRKQLCRRYYLGIMKTIVIYVMCSFVCGFVSGNASTIKQFILGILNFSLAPYSWYVEMYIGLFLLIPFLNLSYHGLQTKSQKQVLLATMLFMTALPSLVNIFDFNHPRWFLFLFSPGNSVQLVPQWWENLYPLTLYFTGCYLSEFKPRVKKKYIFLILLLHILISTIFTFKRSNGGPFLFGSWHEWYSMMNYVTATLIFLFLTNINTENWNLSLKKVIRYFSKITFGAYLLSWIFDQKFYPILLRYCQDPMLALNYFLPVTLLIFICSMAGSGCLNAIYDTVEKIIKIIYSSFKRHKHYANL